MTFKLYLDLRVAALKSTYIVDLAAPSQVKSFQFQVAAEIFHSSRRRHDLVKIQCELAIDSIHHVVIQATGSGVVAILE